MGTHAAEKPLPRKDVAVVEIQLRLHIPKDYRDQFPMPTRLDAGDVARVLVQRWMDGTLPTQELLEMADNIHTTITKPAGLK